jgi:hypothetical protein
MSRWQLSLLTGRNDQQWTQYTHDWYWLEWSGWNIIHHLIRASVNRSEENRMVASSSFILCVDYIMQVVGSFVRWLFLVLLLFCYRSSPMGKVYFVFVCFECAQEGRKRVNERVNEWKKEGRPFCIIWASGVPSRWSRVVADGTDKKNK